MNVAPVKWAQRSATLYITIAVSDATETTIDLTETGLVFTGKSNGKSYALDLEFFADVEKEGSVWNVLPQSIQMKLSKKDKEAEFWPRLLKDKVKEKTNVTIDWDRYVDEVRCAAPLLFACGRHSSNVLRLFSSLFPNSPSSSPPPHFSLFCLTGRARRRLQHGQPRWRQ